METLKTLTARLSEPSTWASIATLLALAHVSVDPGLWSVLSGFGVLIAGGLGVVLREGGTKPVVTVAADVLAAVKS